MVKTMLGSRTLIEPEFFRRLQQGVSANNIGLNKRIRPIDRTVDMGLGCKVHNRIKIMLLKQRFNQSLIGNATVHKSQLLRIFQRLDIFSMTGVSESI